MSKYVITGSCNIPVKYDADGHAYQLLKDGVKVFGGPWATCVREAHKIGKYDDTLTSGSVPTYINQPILQSILHWHRII